MNDRLHKDHQDVVPLRAIRPGARMTSSGGRTTNSGNESPKQVLTVQEMHGGDGLCRGDQ